MSDVCPDCGRPSATEMPDAISRRTACARNFHPVGAEVCAELTLERLRSDLTSANERAVAAANESLRLAGLLEVERGRAAAEQAVLDIVINWRRKDLSLECGPNCGCLDCLADSVDELLALRAGEKAE